MRSNFLASLGSRKLLLCLGVAIIGLMITAENLSVRSRIAWKRHQQAARYEPPASTDTEETNFETSLHNDEEEQNLIRNEVPLESSTVPVVVDPVDQGSKSSKPKKIRICTIALNPRQGSLFRTNLLGQVGSGKYRYAIKPDCQWEDRRVRLISYVKCCESLSKVTRAVNTAVTEFDIVIVTGDEYCYTEDARPQFRQYWGTQIMNRAKNATQIANYAPNNMLLDAEEGVRYPLYIPLGPREEFLQVRIDPKKDILPAAQRKYLYNFLGSMTSYSRQVLKRVVARDLATEENLVKYPGFVHITDKWHLKVTKTNGYIEPDEYKRVLLQSAFTLCPTGHNPEAYRIYEALEAGSIPILAIDPWYERARCQDAFKPYKDAGAPFIYLNGGWRQLVSFFEKRGTNATWVKERQQAVLVWYKKWMNSVALRFEAVLEHRYQKRMKKGKASAERERDEALREAEELEAIKREEEQDGEDEDMIAEVEEPLKAGNKLIPNDDEDDDDDQDDETASDNAD